MLGDLVRQIDLDEHSRPYAELGGAGIQLPDQVALVDGVDPGEGARRLLRLVGLEMSDEMPGQAARSKLIDLVQAFLDAVLAEVALAGRGGAADVLGGKRLRDRDELDAGRRTMRPFGRRVDAAANGREVGGDLRVQELRNTMPAVLT